MTCKAATSALAIVAFMTAPSVALPQTPAAQAPANRPEARPGSPNVLIWLLDDVGFAQLSCFGGLIPTPNIDRVAKMGLRYSNYHTPAICSATRAAMLTGRNPHSVHVGGHAAAVRPFPGYDSQIPASAGTIAENLRQNGYATFALGKWDHLPASEMSPAGPYTYWPIGQGFEHFYGFLSADTDNWSPPLWQDQSPIKPPHTPAYHLNTDLANQAIAMIEARKARDPARPFFMYWATGTAHAPHHAPADWIAKFKGKFDMGWDVAREEILKRQIADGIVPAGTVLAPRPAEMPAWDSLNAVQKRLYARQMEVFAASLAFADHEFGRILDQMEAQGELDNTVVIVTSDNGASAEGAASGSHSEFRFINDEYPDASENMRWFDRWGGPQTYPHYSFGWAVAGNTPFRYYKQTTHEGGIHVPMVVAWPKGIAARGEWRNQFVHVTDLLPTILEAAGAKPAATVNAVSQSPFEGESATYSFASAQTPNRRGPQYFEMYGNRGLWANGWKIVTTHRTRTWDMSLATKPDEPWELYDLTTDPGETRNLATSNPAKVAELAAIFEDQARRFNVNPIGNMSEARGYGARNLFADLARRGGKWTYPAPVWRVSEIAGPPTTAFNFVMTTDVTLPNGAETGPIFARGGVHGGMSFYLKAGKPVFMFRSLEHELTTVASPVALQRGANTVRLEFTRARSTVHGVTDVTLTISANGKPLITRTVSVKLPIAYSIGETFDIGRDEGTAVSPDYLSFAPFAGSIRNMVFQFPVPR